VSTPSWIWQSEMKEFVLRSESTEVRESDSMESFKDWLGISVEAMKVKNLNHSELNVP
jgi:hypothetical protein